MSKRYLGLFLTLLAIEVFIALVIRDRWIRPFVGDVLVVILLYCFVRIFVTTPVVPTIAGVFAFACAIEVSQGFDLANRLHVDHIAVLRVALGTHFDPLDFLAYAIGAGIVWLAERTQNGQVDRAQNP